MKIAFRIVLASLAALLAAPYAAAVDWEVEIEDFAFVPQTLEIDAGDLVEWRNRDNIEHSSTSDNGVWNSGLLSLDETFSFVFNTPGTYPYHCGPHPFMTGTIIVRAVTGVEDPAATPNKFEIAQNYPNPFNARTTIRFGLPRAGRATVEVFNLLGQRVETLLDSEMAAGTHQVVWDAADVPSGVFFYRVAFEGRALTGRMTLLK